MDIGKSIRIALAKANKRQQWLADEIGITRQMMCLAKQNKYATGQRIEALAKAFNMSASEFVKLGEDE